MTVNGDSSWSLKGKKALITGVCLPVDGGFLSCGFTPP
jgi:hypothetical protein